MSSSSLVGAAQTAVGLLRRVLVGLLLVSLLLPPEPLAAAAPAAFPAPGAPTPRQKEPPADPPRRPRNRRR
jgi:hypothetical protein